MKWRIEYDNDVTQNDPLPPRHSLRYRHTNLPLVNIMDKYTAKATILFHGDPSVGIFSYSFEMTLPRVTIEEVESREFARKGIEELYYQLDQEQRPQVIFDDEQNQDD